jgi:hypothetical protein
VADHFWNPPDLLNLVHVCTVDSSHDSSEASKFPRRDNIRYNRNNITKFSTKFSDLVLNLVLANVVPSSGLLYLGTIDIYYLGELYSLVPDMVPDRGTSTY